MPPQKKFMKNLIGGLLKVVEDESMTIMVGSMVAGRIGTAAVAENFTC